MIEGRSTTFDNTSPNPSMDCKVFVIHVVKPSNCGVMTTAAPDIAQQV